MSDAETLEEPKTLRASLEAAFADETPGEGTAAPEGAAKAGADGPSPAASAEGPARDEHGRFAPKEGVKPAETQTIPPPTPAAQAAPEAPDEPIRPPASWSAQAKADFAALPPHIREEVLKRERDVSQGFEERASQLKRYEPLEQVIAPHRERLALAGTDEATYVRSLIAADEMLRGPNRLQAFAQIAQMYGVDLRQFAQPGQPQQPQAQLPPQFQTLAQELAQLKASLTQQQSAQEEAAKAQTAAEIAAFGKDHLYFENVRPQMAALLKAGQAQTLAEAYEKACWAEPSVRPLMLAEQEKAKQAQAAEAARAKVGQARQAAGSITGSPAAGAVPQRSGPAPSIRESLERQLEGRV